MSRKKSIKVDYEADKLRYVIEYIYLPDFKITRPNGSFFYIETKGWFRPEDRRKMKMVKKMNPDVDIRMVFPKDHKISRNTETRYSDWCIKNGYPFCIGEIPESWFE